LAAAQTSNSPAPGDAAPAREATAKRYEEIEILRRLLTGKLEALYPTNVWNRNTASFNGWPSTLQRNDSLWVDFGFPTPANQSGTRFFTTLVNARNPLAWPQLVVAPHWLTSEGVYVKGHGIVYALTLPPPAAPSPTPAAEPAPKPLSEWEQVRRQIRGDKD